MKKILLLLVISLSEIAFSQTKLTHSSDEEVWPGNMAACVTSGPGTINNSSFLRVFDTDDFNVQDSVFFLHIEFGVESAAGGAYELVGRVHELNGPFLFANMTLLAADTANIFPDSTKYVMLIPFKDGFALPGDTIIAEVFAAINAVVTFFPGCNPYLESDPSYIAAPACGILEPTTFFDIGELSAHLVMNLWVNHKPKMADISNSVFKDNVLIADKSDFDLALMDYDSDTLHMIQLLSLPLNGIVEKNALPLVVGDTIWSNELELLSYTPNIGFVGNDSFDFRVRDHAHWSNDSIRFDISVMNWQVTIAENEEAYFEIYPNPATTLIEIKTDAKILNITIYDASGRLKKVNFQSSKSIDISDFENGVYVIEITTENNQFTQKFIKQ